MNYNRFVERIQDHPLLSKHIRDMESATNFTNLVTTEWDSVLRQTDVYDRHAKRRVRYTVGKLGEKKFRNQTILDMDDHYNVIVAGYWHFAPLEEKGNTFTLVCRGCKPLSLMGESMSEGDTYVFRDNCRFFVEECDGSICAACQSCRTERHRYDESDWCVRMTRVFDGRNVKNMLKSQILRVFSNMRAFNGILRLCVKSRCSFMGNSYKIGGMCKEMLLFPDSALDTDDTLALCQNSARLSLPCPAAGDDSPKIEYPNEEENHPTTPSS